MRQSPLEGPAENPDQDPHWQPHQTDFNEVLYEQLRKTPWFMTSLVIHLVAFLVLGNLSFADIARETRSKVEANLAPEQEEELIDQEEEQIEEEKPEEEPIDQPDVDEIQTDDDVETTQAEAEDDATADQPYEGKQSNAAIGLGGGAGGAFGGRRGGRRGLRRRYGGQGTAEAVEMGLEWLAKHQTPEEGYWDCDGFQEQCKGNICDGKGYPLYDPGISGLALLAFLGAGYTHQAGRYKKTVLPTVTPPDFSHPNRSVSTRRERKFWSEQDKVTVNIPKGTALIPQMAEPPKPAAELLIAVSLV